MKERDEGRKNQLRCLGNDFCGYIYGYVHRLEVLLLCHDEPPGEMSH